MVRFSVRRQLLSKFMVGGSSDGCRLWLELQLRGIVDQTQVYAFFESQRLLKLRTKEAGPQVVLKVIVQICAHGANTCQLKGSWAADRTHALFNLVPATYVERSNGCP